MDLSISTQFPGPISAQSSPGGDESCAGVANFELAKPALPSGDPQKKILNFEDNLAALLTPLAPPIPLQNINPGDFPPATGISPTTTNVDPANPSLLTEPGLAPTNSLLTVLPGLNLANSEGVANALKNKVDAPATLETPSAINESSTLPSKAVLELAQHSLPQVHQSSPSLPQVKARAGKLTQTSDDLPRSPLFDSIPRVELPKIQSGPTIRETGDPQTNLVQGKFAGELMLIPVRGDQSPPTATIIIQADQAQPLLPVRKAQMAFPVSPAAQGVVGMTILAKPDQTLEPRPALSDQLKDAITSRIDGTGPYGRTEIRLRLDPPDLGSVRIQLTASDDQLSGRFLVQNEAARVALEAHLHSLRDRLNESGLLVGRFDVAREGMGHFGRGQPDPHWFRGEEEIQPLAPRPSPGQSLAGPPSSPIGQVDYLA